MNTAIARSIASSPQTAEALTILYGSQTGNGLAIAAELEQRARNEGFAANLINLADFRARNLKREQQVVFVVSTHGEGEPPDDAELFHEFLLSGKTGELAQLRYSVLALGDSSYVNYCQTGREIDTKLAELGAERISPLVECDLDYENDAAMWTGAIIDCLPDMLQARAVPQLRAVKSVATPDRHKPFRAEVLVNQKISGAGSDKDVRHIELSLEDSGLVYEPGDVVAVSVDNPPQLVAQLVRILGANGGAIVEVNGAETTLTDALTALLEITVSNVNFIRSWAQLAGADDLLELLEPEHKKRLGTFIEEHQLIDIVRKYPAAASPQEFVSMLRKLSPRSYSIASSLQANPDEVHLTVAAVEYEAFGSTHWGAASTYLADRVQEGETVNMTIESNPRFRLPGDEVPIIMIGPGTGVAPFRAFVEERAERGAAGDNWLIFGNRTFADDFLYQLEWHRHVKQGNLQRLDVAFSRDQEEKVYVQQRIRENAADVFEWLERGAHVYVCGDAKRMAADVDEALVEVIEGQAGVERDEAVQRLKKLRRDGRYQRDVY